MEDWKDKIPTATELVENSEKATEVIEKRPVGSTVYWILVISIGTSIYFAWTAYQAQKQLNEMARIAFTNAIEKKAQQEVIEVQGKVIDSAKTYIQDSIQPVNVKNYSGDLKIKTK